MAQPPYPGYYPGVNAPPPLPSRPPFPQAPYGVPPPMPPYAQPPYPGRYMHPGMYQGGTQPYPQQQFQPPIHIPPPPAPYPSAQSYSAPPAPPGPPTQNQGYVLSGAARPSPLLARSGPAAPASHLLKPMTVFISHIADNVDDLCMRQLLDQCGRVVKWNRVLDPKTLHPRSFGFCQFLGPAGLVGALKLLSGVKLNDDADDIGLLVKIDPKSEPICSDYSNENVEKEEEWHVKETIVSKIIQDRKLRLAEEKKANGHIIVPSLEDSDGRKRARTESPTPIEPVDEIDDGKPSAVKKLGWKKSSVVQKAKVAPVLDAFANTAEDSHVATLYSRKEREIKPLLTDPELIWQEVPKEHGALINYKFDWGLVDRNAFLNGAIKTFVTQRVCEYLGQPEPHLVTFIMNLLMGDKPFDEIVSEVKVVFSNDSELFMKKIWSQMVFEYLSMERS